MCASRTLQLIRLGSTWEIGNETSQGDNTTGFTLTVLDTGGVYGTMVSGTSNAVWTYTPKDI